MRGQKRCYNSTCDISRYQTTDCPLSAYCQVPPEVCRGDGAADCRKLNRLSGEDSPPRCLSCLPGYLEPTADANAQNSTCLVDCSLVARLDICSKLHRANCNPLDAVSQQPNSCGACQRTAQWQAPASGSSLEACVANCTAHPPARCAALNRQPCDPSSVVRPGCGDPLFGHAFPSPAASDATFYSYSTAIEGGLSEEALLGLRAEVLCQVATPIQCASLHRKPCGKGAPNECGDCMEGFEFPQGSNQLELDTCSPVKEPLLSNAHIFIGIIFASLAVVLLLVFAWCRVRHKKKSSAGKAKPLFMFPLLLLSFTLSLLFVYNAHLQGYSIIFALSAATVAARLAAGVLASVQWLSTEMKASEAFKTWLFKHNALRLPILVVGAINTDNLLLFTSKLGSFDALSAPLRAESEDMIEAKGLYVVLAGDLPLWAMHIPFVVVQHDKEVPAFVFLSMVLGFALLCVNIGKRCLARMAPKPPPADPSSPAGTSGVELTTLPKAMTENDASGSDSHSDATDCDTDAGANV